MRRILLILVFCFFLSSQLMATTYTFVPGYGIENMVYIESKVEDIVPAVLGKPDLVYNQNKTKHAIFEKYGIELMARGGLIEGIKMTAPFYFTREGIGIGSAYEQVISLYGSDYMTLSSPQNTKNTRIGYVELGVAFTFRNSDNTVKEITLVKPNTPFSY